MINRENYLAVKRYLAYRQEVEQVSPSSARLEESWLRHVLEWAQERHFSQAPRIKPAFPAYILTARRDGKREQLSRVYVHKVIRSVRRFFEWLRIHQQGYGAITVVYLDTLRTPRMEEQPQEHEAVTVDEVRAMARAEVCNLGEERIRAAAVFLFLSGIRVRAFTTLPLEAVDIQARTVRQWPSLGVKTKGSKHADTYLLPIPDLLEVVQAWDDLIRPVLPPDAMWFAPLTPHRELDPTGGEPGDHRHARVRRDLGRWLDRVGLPYHSPHKFRHGHAVYSLKQASDVADLKAISSNLMHASLTVTDSIYAVLSHPDVKARIEALGQDGQQGRMDIAAVLRELADKLENGKSGN